MRFKCEIANSRVVILALMMLATGRIPISAQIFTNLHGIASSYGELVLSGNRLYGTTYNGGSLGVGNVFAINADGSSFTNLHDCGGDGNFPYGGLVLSGSILYGVATAGGSSGAGTVFAVYTNGTGFTNLYTFKGGNDGGGPYGKLVVSGSTLYGTTGGGGISGKGTIFSIHKDGSSFTNLYGFAGGADGATPYAGLQLLGNTLYGTATAAGSFGFGTVFKINTDGSGFTNLHAFAGSDGSYPYGEIILSGGMLHGTAYAGGSSQYGTVFEVSTDGSGFAILHTFTDAGHGYSPQAGLASSPDGTLYGTTYFGGVSGVGTVFKINSDGSDFVTLYNFAGGGYPHANLIWSGNALYGTTYGGQVFRLNLRNTPVIITQPTNQSIQAGSNVTFSAVTDGAPPLHYQWRFNGQNISGANSSTLTLNSVNAANSGGYSIVVSNPYGSVTSATASLAVLTDGANGNNPNQMPVSAAPPQPAGVNTLVLVTHGWEPGPFADVSWITDMANAIHVKAPNCSVLAFNWMGAAWFPDPDLTLVSGAALGTLYAKLRLEPQHWQHIHFIAHSAGSAVIEAMARELRSSLNPPLTIQETFLDPYTGFTSLTGRGVYGANADWADNYSALGSFVDFAPSIIGLGNATVGKLENAYNADVGWIDPKHWTIPYGSGQIALASHEWPHNFYMESIANTDPGWKAHGYGFPLSMEGGGGNNNLVNFPEGLDPFPIGGPLNALQSPFQQQSLTQLALDGLAHAVSSVGASLVGSAGFVLNNIPFVLPVVKDGGIHPLGGPVPQGGTPAWLAVGVTVTNPVNLVQFDAGFTDTNAAEGLLTVYWNTNQIGLVDERAASTNLQTFRFALPSTIAGGIYTLSFRLDSFDSALSSIVVTNVAMGFVGVTQPITLGISLTNGLPILQLTAAPNFNYLIQSSTNLVNWTPTALLVNSNGTVAFPVPMATNSSAQFYRAIMP